MTLINTSTIIMKKQGELAMTKKLMTEWLLAKEREDEANKDRLNIEIQLYKAITEKTEIPKEGVTKFEDDGVKCTITSKFNVTVDQEQAALRPELFSVKYDYSKTKLKNFTPTELSAIQDIVTFKPGKPSFKVEVL